MITTDFPVALACGSISAVIQTRFIEATQPNPLSGRVAWLGAALAGGYALCASFMIIHYPAWMYGYAADPAKLSGWFAFALFVPLMAFTGFGGSVIAQLLIEQDKLRFALALAGSSLVLCGLNIVALLDAFTHVGTFAQWCGGTAPSMQDPALSEFRVRYNAVGAVFAAGAISVAVWLVREALRLGPQRR